MGFICQYRTDLSLISIPVVYFMQLQVHRHRSYFAAAGGSPNTCDRSYYIQLLYV